MDATPNETSTQEKSKDSSKMKSSSTTEKNTEALQKK